MVCFGLLVLFLLCRLHFLYLALLIGLLLSGCWGVFDKLPNSLSGFLSLEEYLPAYILHHLGWLGVLELLRNCW